MNTFSETKAIASCFYECYNRKDLEKSFNDFIAPDLINHTMGGGMDREEWLNFDKAFLNACPNLTLTVKEQFAEGNKVVTLGVTEARGLAWRNGYSEFVDGISEVTGGNSAFSAKFVHFVAN